MLGHCCVPKCRGNYDGEKTACVHIPIEPFQKRAIDASHPREDLIPGKRSVVRASFIFFLVVCELLLVHILTLHVACLASNIHSLEMCVSTISSLATLFCRSVEQKTAMWCQSLYPSLTLHVYLCVVVIYFKQPNFLKFFDQKPSQKVDPANKFYIMVTTT